jgi:MFS family permease
MPASVPVPIHARQDPPSLLRLPRFRRLLYAQACFGVAYSTFMILPKYLATHMGAGPARIGWIMAAGALAPVLGAPVVSHLCRRLGAATTVALASAVMAVGSAAFIAVDSPGPLAFFCRGLQGLAWALVFSASSLLVLELAGPGRVNEGVSLHGSANLITSAIGPAVAEPLLEHGGATPVFAAAALVASGGVWLALGIGHGRARTGDAEAATATGPAGRPEAAALSMPILLVSGVLGIACGVMLILSQPLALGRGLFRVSDFLVAFTVGAVAVRLGSARWPDRVGVGRVAVASFVLYGAVVAAMATLASPLGLVLLGVGFGIAHGLFWPSFLALAVAAQPAAAGRARLLSWMNAMYCAGVAAVGLLGSLAERVGFPLVFLGVGLLTVLSALGLRRFLARAAAWHEPVLRNGPGE